MEHDQLTSLTALWQPVLAEIRKGVALDYAKNIGNTEGFRTPVPNFLTAQIGAKMLCVEGLFFESQERYDEALDNYLTALTMGRDYGAEGSPLIGHLISIAIDSIALERIHQVVGADGLSQAARARALERMKEVEASHQPILSGFQFENSALSDHLAQLHKNPDLFWQGQKRETLVGLIMEGRFTWDRYRKVSEKRAEIRRMQANPQKAKRDHEAIWAKRMEMLETEWWDPKKIRLEKEIEVLYEDAHPLIKMVMPNYMEVEVRYRIMISRLREACQTAALEAWRREKGRYPESLEPLRDEFFAPTLPVDPFSGKAFRYATTSKGSSYVLWGIGPDSVDDGGTLLYDPTNGTRSQGDIRYR